MKGQGHHAVALSGRTATPGNSLRLQMPSQGQLGCPLGAIFLQISAPYSQENLRFQSQICASLAV